MVAILGAPTPRLWSSAGPHSSSSGTPSP